MISLLRVVESEIGMDFSILSSSLAVTVIKIHKCALQALAPEFCDGNDIKNRQQMVLPHFPSMPDVTYSPKSMKLFKNFLYYSRNCVRHVPSRPVVYLEFALLLKYFGVGNGNDQPVHRAVNHVICKLRTYRFHTFMELWKTSVALEQLARFDCVCAILLPQLASYNEIGSMCTELSKKIHCYKTFIYQRPAYHLKFTQYEEDKK